MPMFTKVAGQWREITGPRVKVNGTWREVTNAWTKVGGVWRETYTGKSEHILTIGQGGAFANRGFSSDSSIGVFGEFQPRIMVKEHEVISIYDSGFDFWFRIVFKEIGLPDDDSSFKELYFPFIDTRILRSDMQFLGGESNTIWRINQVVFEGLNNGHQLVAFFR